MSSKQQSESQDYVQRIKKKLKKQQTPIEITPPTDITQLSLQKYKTIKDQHHFVSFQQSQKSKQILSGKVEAYSAPLFDFNQQMYNFRRLGYCSNPDTTNKGLLFSKKHQALKNLSEFQGEIITQTHPQFLSTLYNDDLTEKKKIMTKLYKQQRDKGEGDLDYLGPWAGYGENLQNGGLTVQQKQMLAKAQTVKQVRIEQSKRQEKAFEPYSIFHWGQYTDYKNLSYVQPPVDYKRGPQNCYLPKKQVFSWVTSQKQGYQAVRFFPKVGHFFLLSTPEGKAHLFNVQKKTCAHTYIGHAKAIRDIQFSHDGKHFLTAAFDNKVLFWDTEYGKVGAVFNLKKIPLSLKFHPSQHHPNVFFCGTSVKKIFQFDLRTGQKTMDYTQHLGAVNTITFIQQNKFVSSSDDKKLFIWEYGVPVVTRHVSEPEMHTITATAMHPSGQYFAGQSSDNQVVIYENKGGVFRRIRAKTFASHYCAGYACAIDFSYDGQFLVSGDERGKLYFYDWKTCKPYRVLDGHAGACIGVQWHPSQPTTVLSCGWDGTVKLWQ